jgi:hypothetical protein
MPGFLRGELICRVCEEQAVELTHRTASRGVRITLATAGICALAIGLSCPSRQSLSPGATIADKRGEIVVFFTGNVLGALKPCGCSGGQLGGLERRTSVFATVPKANRLTVDTGSLVQSDREQDLLKFRILLEAMRLLGYDLVHLSPQDVEIASSLGVLNSADQPFDTIATSGQGTNLPRSFARQFVVGDRRICINVAAFDARTGPPEQVAGLFPDSGSAEPVNILILAGCEGRAVQDVLRTIPPVVDCVVCPSDADEPRLVSGPNDRPLAFTIGRFGRYISHVGIGVSPQQRQLTLRFASTPVEEKLAKDDALIRLYRSYQQLVSDSKLLEKSPRIPLPQDGITFVGSKACAPCHEYEYEKCSVQPHATAFASLEKVGSDRDPECVICHVVGMEYSGGFVTAEQTPDLKDVGCEVCHGPGSEHSLTDGVIKTAGPQKSCLACHTPEHSGGYAGHEEEFMKKIEHRREP